MCSGERPIGAAKGKQSDTEALCQPPPPLWWLGSTLHEQRHGHNAWDCSAPFMGTVR